jgi:microcystin-dependent protein
MSEPFLAEIRIVGFDFAPRGWAFCNGQVLPINQNQSLFSLLGTTYGGDGRINFQLPDLRGRTPIFTAQEYRLGQSSGEESVALTAATTPTHSHTPMASGALGSSSNPTNALWAKVTNTVGNLYADPGQTTPSASMNGFGIVNQGSGQGHDNMQPFLVLNFCIALQGLYPSRD